MEKRKIGAPCDWRGQWWLWGHHECHYHRETGNEARDDKAKNSQLFAGMLVGEELVKIQIDCGATCNVIPINLLNPDTQMEHTKKVLVIYNKTKLHPLGKCKVKVRNPRNQKLYRLEFVVVDKDCKLPLLGRKASEAMKLIKVQTTTFWSSWLGDGNIEEQAPGIKQLKVVRYNSNLLEAALKQM